jgi:hypothetical protein
MSSPFAASKVENVCRKTCQLTRFVIPARRLAGRIYGKWILSVCCRRRKRDFEWEAPYAYKARPGQTIIEVPTFFVSEGDAVIAAVRLAEKGLLERVRHCATCSKTWIFARHRNYRFCVVLVARPISQVLRNIGKERHNRCGTTGTD